MMPTTTLKSPQAKRVSSAATNYNTVNGPPAGVSKGGKIELRKHNFIYGYNKPEFKSSSSINFNNVNTVMMRKQKECAPAGGNA